MSLNYHIFPTKQPHMKKPAEDVKEPQLWLCSKMEDALHAIWCSRPVLADGSWIQLLR